MGKQVHDHPEQPEELAGTEAAPEAAPAELTAAEPPVMPAPPFPAFQSVPTLPQQAPGVGFESGRDSRAR